VIVTMTPGFGRPALGSGKRFARLRMPSVGRPFIFTSVAPGTGVLE
jgi:hypothetical protein